MKISVQHNDIADIARHFGCSRSFACRALKFKVHSYLATQIRNFALNEKGGYIDTSIN